MNWISSGGADEAVLLWSLFMLSCMFPWCYTFCWMFLLQPFIHARCIWSYSYSLTFMHSCACAEIALSQTARITLEVQAATLCATYMSFSGTCHTPRKMYLLMVYITAVSTIRVYAITGRQVPLALLVMCLSLVPVGTNIVRTALSWTWCDSDTSRSMP